MDVGIIIVLSSKAFLHLYHLLEDKALSCMTQKPQPATENKQEFEIVVSEIENYSERENEVSKVCTLQVGQIYLITLETLSTAASRSAFSACVGNRKSQKSTISAITKFKSSQQVSNKDATPKGILKYNQTNKEPKLK